MDKVHKSNPTLSILLWIYQFGEDEKVFDIMEKKRQALIQNLSQPNTNYRIEARLFNTAPNLMESRILDWEVFSFSSDSS